MFALEPGDLGGSVKVMPSTGAETHEARYKYIAILANAIQKTHGERQGKEIVKSRSLSSAELSKSTKALEV